jgi:hypothetical protein
MHLVVLCFRRAECSATYADELDEVFTESGVVSVHDAPNSYE